MELGETPGNDSVVTGRIQKAGLSIASFSMVSHREQELACRQQSREERTRYCETAIWVSKYSGYLKLYKHLRKDGTLLQMRAGKDLRNHMAPGRPYWFVSELHVVRQCVGLKTGLATRAE